MLLIFMGIATLISLWSLYIYRSAIIILIVSIVLAYFVHKKGFLDFGGISTAAFGMALLVAVLAAYPYLFVTPFVDASADPAAHISSLAIHETEPKTYAPFSELQYRYQIGFPLLAKMFIDILPFVSSNTIVWFLGVVFAFLSALLVYLLAKEIFSNEKAGMFALALFIGSKIVFQNMYWGQYTFILASVFFLATFLAFKKKSVLAYLFFPMMVASHPGVTFYALLFFMLWAVYFKEIKETFLLLLSGFIVLPVFFISYVNYIANVGAEPMVTLSFASLVSNAVVFAFWIGAFIFVLCIASLIYAWNNKKLFGMNMFLGIVFVVSGAATIFLNASGRILGGRVIELSMFTALLLAAYLLTQLIESRMLEKFSFMKSKAFASVFAIVLIVSLALFFSSGQLTHLRHGSKINNEQIEFAYAFKTFDSDYKKTLFLTENSAKIAEVSQKIPFDVLTDYYLSYDPKIAANDPFYQEFVRMHVLAEKARSEQCVECIAQADFEYIVTENDFFSSELSVKKVFEHGSYKVFVRG
ncbi:MAG TPA: hypothetical protein VFF13_05760 [archaeon]|nr:hypothetical protein [archaeon]